jgi:DNA-binding transcriptional regulator YdaS (Cro superfamily)
MVTVSEIIATLGGLTKVARLLGRPVTTVQKWRDSRRIPPEHWLALVRHAHSIGRTDINADLLAKLHATPVEVTQ